MDRADDLDPVDAELIRRLVPATPSSYHRLNPLTKAVIATVGSIGVHLCDRSSGKVGLGSEGSLRASYKLIDDDARL